MSEAYIEKLQEKNIEDIIGMMRDFYAIDNYPFKETETRDNFHKFCANPELGQAFLLFNNEHEIIGYVIMAYLFSFEFGGRIAFLDELFLTEKVRGQGYGKVAVDFVKEFAAEKQLKVVMLEIERHNRNAYDLYISKGFKEHYRNLMIYTPQ